MMPRSQRGADRADQRAAELARERDQVMHQVEAGRSELAAWREGGPLARAIRAFLYQRVV
jgi:hypothetical protein